MIRLFLLVCIVAAGTYLLTTTSSSPKTYTNTGATPSISQAIISQKPKNSEPLLLTKDTIQNTISQDVYSSSSPPTLVPPEEHSSATDQVHATMTSPHTWGVHVRTINEFVEAEQRLGAEADLVAVHIHWGNENAFPTHVSSHLSSEQTLFIFWNAMDYTKKASGQSDFHFANILRGDWDDYIDSFVADARNYGYSVVLIPFEEINGYWTHWSGDEGGYGTIEEYKQTYHYLYEKFEGVPNVSFGWVLNNVSVPNTPENALGVYYPGDAYVDVIGLNGFNFGEPWLSFDELFTDSVELVAAYGKPIYLTSLASAEDARKADWIEGFFAHPLIAEQQVEGWIWFNEDKERDWRIWSDTDSLETFKAYLAEE